MNYTKGILAIALLLITFIQYSNAQDAIDNSLLTIDRIYNSTEFDRKHMKAIKWIDGGDSYIIIEDGMRGNELIKYNTLTQRSTKYLSAAQLSNDQTDGILNVEDFSLSQDQSKVLLFTNSRRVWRSNTKGDYWVYDFNTETLSKLGAQFPSSSLMFAKFSEDNKYAAYVQDFNIYIEVFATGEISQLTSDGSRDIINGTFDWVYEEEFGCRDGFRWNTTGSHIAYWQLDASNTGEFYMINNTDSIYPQLIPLQYPKVGEEPSACRLGLIDIDSKESSWIDIPGGLRENYIPAIQWVDDRTILIQQINRHQNHLKILKYDLTDSSLELLYEEKEETWVDLKYPDPTANGWGRTDMHMADNGQSFLRMSETEGWRHVYKVEIETGQKQLSTPGSYDVASVQNSSNGDLYFMASPENNTQRFLYHIKLNGSDEMKRLTPRIYDGINRYNVSPNGKFAIHSHTSHMEPSTVHLIELPQHNVIRTIVGNDIDKRKLNNLALPEVEFFQVTTAEGITIDGRMIKPIGFNPNTEYPVLFHVYGEPWGQVAQDAFIGLQNIMWAQQGYVIIDMDNRGTPVLNGSEWRKSIYRKVGLINTRDQALAAKEVLKWDFIDSTRTAVWGWSGGGSMTLNLLFQYPEIYKTGMSIAAVANQLAYDNIYQERYMGLPQENMSDFVDGSPMTYAKNLQGNLLYIHGTADDNVHYQNAEMLINELIKHNKDFDLMIYPNRSHGIWEGENTRRHLYKKMTNYLLEHCPPNK